MKVTRSFIQDDKTLPAHTPGHNCDRSTDNCAGKFGQFPDKAANSSILSIFLKRNPVSNLAERIKQFNSSRLPAYTALKYQTMAENPFRFFRGTCHLFYE